VADLARLAVSNLVVMLMLVVGLGARPADIIGELRRPGRLGIGIAAIDIVVPLLTIAVAVLMPIPEAAAKLFVAFGICPAAPIAIRGLEKRGAGPIGLALVVVLLAGSVVTVPLWLWILEAAHAVPARSYAGDVAAMLAWKLLLPLAVGMALRSVAPKVADVAGRVLNVVFVATLLLALLVLLKQGISTLLGITVPVAVAALLILAGGVLVGRLAPPGDPPLRDAISTIAARSNPALALAVISQHDPSLDWGAGVAAYILFRTIALVPLERLLHPRRAPSAPSS